MPAFEKIPDSEVTPPAVYFNRRTFIRGAAAVASIAATGFGYRLLNPIVSPGAKTKKLDGTLNTAPAGAGFIAEDPMTPVSAITTYNNFYEFSTEKEAVAGLATRFDTTGWKLEVGGMVRNPMTLDMDGLRKIAPTEERRYRLRCVERWSMVIPWDGFSLSALLDKVEPLSGARYVAFQTLMDPKRFPNQKDQSILPWPYVEGLRLDEAMHPLTMLATGLYGSELPPQDGAPVRLVTPWKYGYKSIKSLVKITLTAEQPPCTWNIANPPAYGFYSNVNPQVARPWDQSTERRFDGTGAQVMIPTRLFNGYADEVASLYRGMDLAKDY